VVAVDLRAGSLTLDCSGRRVGLGGAFLTSANRDRDPTLVHGYAMTGHVAQGATVDRAFVLASEGMSREWAYVALSRGRLSNRLYVAEQPDDDRAEFAPTTPDQRDPIARLAAALRDSEARVLAIDTGDPGLGERRQAAERVAERAFRDRRALERRRFQWLPGRRRQLEAARGRENVAAMGVREASRAEAELWHGTRHFVSERELEAQRDQRLIRFAENATERVLRRDRGIGRER
jgi:hypothetical protein